MSPKRSSRVSRTVAKSARSRLPRRLASLAGAGLLGGAVAAGAADPVVPAAAPAPAKEIAVLFAGYPHAGCGFELATRLQKEGFALNAMTHPALEGPALTWDRVKSYNVIVLAGLGLSNADYTLTDKNKANIEVLNRFLNEGGGILYIPYWGQMNTLLPPQEAFIKPYGLTPLFDEVVVDPDTSVRATSWKIDFANTTTAATDSPLTAEVTSFWYPVATRAGAQQHTTTFTCDANWTVVLRGGKGSSSRKLGFESFRIDNATTGTVATAVPLVASRQVGKGRLVCLGITPEYLFTNVGLTTLESIVFERGLRKQPSHGYTLVRNALKWLGEASAAAGSLGGAKMDAALTQNAYKPKTGGAWNWAKDNQPPAANPARPGIVGARTAYSSGKGTVTEWVAQAKAAGLSWIVFLEEFAAMTPANFAKLKEDCAKQTSGAFAAIPGFVIDDELGNHYFYFAPALPYPEKKCLSDDGKVFVSCDPELDPKNPRVKGQLAMTTLLYAYSYGSFKLTAGNYLFRQSAAPFAHFYSNWDATAVLTTKTGEVLEDATAEYLQLVDAGQGPTPLVLSVLTDPGQLAACPWRTVLRLPATGGSAVGDELEGKDLVGAYWSQWHFYPDNPSRVYISSGPEIENWSFVGQRDYGGDNAGDFVWQNLRWLVHGKVKAAAGLKEVAVYDGPELFRRFLPEGKNEFEFTLDLAHDKQHNLVLVATDMKGGRAVSGEQWDRNHRLEEFNCSDRNNQLSYGYLIDSQGRGIMIGGNQPLATPNKRIDDRHISPAGTFKNDALLGAPAFDGGAGGEPPFFAPAIINSEKGEVHPPGIAEARRLLHTGDVNIGEGLWTHNVTDGVRVANVWHSLWKTEPAKDFTGRKRNIFVNIDPDSPLAVFIWQQDIKLLRDIPNRGMLAGMFRTDEARLWAARGSDGTVISGAWEDSVRSQPRTVALPFGLGAYAALLDSPLGGAAVFPLSDGLELQLALPDRQHRNVSLYQPAARTPQKAGETGTVSFLLVGIPRATDYTRHLPAPSTEVVERFWRDFGLNPAGKPAYTLTAKAGTVTGQRYVLDIDGRTDGCFSGALQGKLVSTLPIAVAGLNDRWSALLYDRGLKKARPIGILEGKAWAAVPMRGAADLFVGHPVLADNAELFLQLTQTAEASWRLEIHNPTAKPVRATVRANPHFDPLQGKPFQQATLDVPAGTSVVREL